MTASRPCRTPERVDGGEVLVATAPTSRRRRRPTNSTRRRRAEPGEHVRDEPLVAGDVDEGELARRPAASVQRVAEVDGQPAAALLRPAVGLHAGRARGRASTCRGRRDRRWRRRASGADRAQHGVAHARASSVGGHAAQVEQAAVVLDAGDHRRSAGAQRSRELRRAARRPSRAARGRARRRRRPRRRSARPCRRPPRRVRRTASRSASGIGLEGRARSASPARSSVASSAARVSLSTRSARASGWRRSRCTSSARAEHEAGLRAAEQLVAAGGDEVGALRRAPWRRPARPGSSGCGASSPLPMSTTTGTPSVGEVARPATALVKPSMRKLLGCTLRMQPVSGPIAAA